jgi:hypothetical protein
VFSRRGHSEVECQRPGQKETRKPRSRDRVSSDAAKQGQPHAQEQASEGSRRSRVGTREKSDADSKGACASMEEAAQMTQQHGKCGEGTQPPLSSHPMHRQPICTCATPNWPAALSRCPPLAPGSCSPARWAALSSSRPAVRLSLGRVATRPGAAVCAHVICLRKRMRHGTGLVWRAKARTPRRGGGPQVSSMSWRFTRPRNTTSCVAWGRGEGGATVHPDTSHPFLLF